MRRLVVPQGERRRLSDFLPQALCLAQRGAIRRALERRDVRREGVRLGAQDWVCAGDELDVYIDDRLLLPAPLYRDEGLLAIDKPAGAPSTGPLSAQSALNLLVPQAQACHRLDSATCGVLLFALNERALWDMQGHFKHRRVGKTYRCRALGRPPRDCGELVHYLRKDAQMAKVHALDAPADGALRAALRYRLLCEEQGTSLLEIELLTGRTHQIRAQLAHIGLPILGDDLYGDRQANRQSRSRRLWLQSVRLSLPKGQDMLSICAAPLRQLMTPCEREG